MAGSCCPKRCRPEKRRPFEWRRANPFGTFKVFRRYSGVLPLCGVLVVFFFASSVYPAIWPFWGMAKFGWSVSMVGLTLAALASSRRSFRAGCPGLAVARLGEYRVALIGLCVGGDGGGGLWSCGHAGGRDRAAGDSRAGRFRASDADGDHVQGGAG